METGDDIGEILDLGSGQCPCACQLVEQHGAVEAPHLEDSVDERAAAVQCEFAIGLDGNAVHATIEIRRRLPVQFQFALAKLEPALRAGKIDIGKAHRPLQLESTLAKQQHRRDMRRDRLVRRPIRAERPPRAQEGDDVVLPVGIHAAVSGCTTKE
ncbi:hypothetical protein [Bosea sp. (in: a-proteobacteria)]|uniref:hypothetical protein n=1 Tax=Bosea sp. (in: a-proteobacteria) TaxID=1871050 RepID=UPI0025C63497|nr:hypothetical protein [Bosea sp. (in: a-proteobacteria)]